VIPYGRQDITQADIDAVIGVLKSDFLTQGPLVAAFEGAVANKVSAKYAVAVNSATSALHVACLAFGLKQGDWLWTSPITFVASANCALYCGAQVDFVDIDPRTYNLCPQELEKKLIVAEKEGRLPKIVIPVHLAGQSCDMQAIHALAKKYHFKIIEDASHAIGGKYQDQYIGSCKYSDITIFSFHPVKIITTGEGGMAITNDESLASKMRLFRSHGITKESNEMTKVAEGPWYYEQIDLGFNYRMTDIQAALGLSQLARLDEFVASRHRVSNQYQTLLSELSLNTPYVIPDAFSSLHLYIVQLQPKSDVKLAHKRLFEYMRSEEIGVALHYIPIYRHPYYLKYDYVQSCYPHAEDYYSRAISLPIYPNLQAEEMQAICRVIADGLNLKG
jgi:UDP-4-amino-4,6-dideoxy-N-acetyl-beta-L-altrosamine transaminase